MTGDKQIMSEQQMVQYAGMSAADAQSLAQSIYTSFKSDPAEAAKLVQRISNPNQAALVEFELQHNVAKQNGLPDLVITNDGGHTSVSALGSTAASDNHAKR